MFRGIRPLVMLASLFAFTSSTARAADWASPLPVVFASQSGQHGFKVLPKSFEAASGLKILRCRWGRLGAADGQYPRNAGDL
jgi:hypothetical protein